MNGFLVLDKPEGVTSFKAASAFRKILNERKTGHTGTLDPMATGVLPVAFGKATRFIDYLPDSGKAYTARFKFGLVTDTLDITGKILEECEADISKETVESVLGEFRGDIMQMPPMYSALSVNGVKLYKLARQGVEIEREKRQIRIDELELTGVYGDEFEITVSCSKGTYIRSLIADIGEKVGSGAVMTALRRTRSNGFSIEDALTPEKAEELGAAAVMSIDKVFECYPGIYVSEAQSVRFSNGGDLFTERIKNCPGEGNFRVYSPDGKFLGLGEIKKEDTSLLIAKKVMGNDI